MSHADMSAVLNTLLADPVFLAINIILCLGICIATYVWLRELPTNEAGDTHLEYRTANGDLIEQQTRELQRQWLGHTQQARMPVGPNGQCQPACTLTACDMNSRCARLRLGKGRVVTLQRLTTREIALIQFGARQAAKEDHERGAPERRNPMPHHTRAAAVWSIEYCEQRHLLTAFEQAL